MDAFAQGLRTSLRSRSKGLVAAGILLLACISIPLAYVAFLNENPDQNFWFVPRPPIPAYASHVQYLDGGSLPGSRITRFVTDQPAEKVRQFYRAELPRLGWQLLCSPVQLEPPDCPLGLSPDVELADAYTRPHEPSQVRAVDISVYKPGQFQVDAQHRMVEIIEYRYSRPSP